MVGLAIHECVSPLNSLAGVALGATNPGLRGQRGGAALERPEVDVALRFGRCKYRLDWLPWVERRLGPS